MPTLGSFEEWIKAIADPVMWVTGLNPLEVREDTKVNDTDSRLKIALVQGWSELPGSDVGLTVSAALKHLKDDTHQTLYEVLRSALMEISDKGDLPSAKSIGRILTACKGRNLGDLMLLGTPDRNKIFAWKVVQPKKATPPNGSAGFAGFAGSGSPATHAQQTHIQRRCGPARMGGKLTRQTRQTPHYDLIRSLATTGRSTHETSYNVRISSI